MPVVSKGRRCGMSSGTSGCPLRAAANRLELLAYRVSFEAATVKEARKLIISDGYHAATEKLKRVYDSLDVLIEDMIDVRCDIRAIDPRVG